MLTNDQSIDEKDVIISELMRKIRSLEQDLAAKDDRIAKLETTLREQARKAKEQISKAKQMKENFIKKARNDESKMAQQKRVIKGLSKERLAVYAAHSEMENVVGGYEAELAHQFSAFDGLSKRYHELLTYIEVAGSSGHLPVTFDIEQFYFC